MENRSSVKREKSCKLKKVSHVVVVRKIGFLDPVLRRESGAEESDQDRCQAEAEDSPDYDFAGPVADAFLEMWELTLVYFSAELVDQHVEVASLVAEYHPDTQSVIDDDEGEADRDRESAGIHAFEVADGSEERDRKSGMGARHVTMGEYVFRFPTVAQREEDEFDDLRKKTDENREKEDKMRLNEGRHIFRGV